MFDWSFDSIVSWSSRQELVEAEVLAKASRISSKAEVEEFASKPEVSKIALAHGVAMVLEAPLELGNAEVGEFLLEVVQPKIMSQI